MAVCLALMCAAAASAHAIEHADLVVSGAKVITVDDAQPTAEGIAVRDGRFVAVGSDADIGKLIGPNTQVVEAEGRVVVPGFNDAHLHPSPLFDEMSPLGRVDCGPSRVADIDALIEALRKKADRTPAGQWVKGFGYQDTKLGRHPTREDLDRVSTEHPVYVSHSSGHLAAVNSAALALANVTAETRDPRGGKFGRDASGRMTGLLHESAKDVVNRAGPDDPVPTTKQWVEGIHRRFAGYLKRGITSVQHAGASPTTLGNYAIALAHKKQVRLYVMLHRSHVGQLEKIVATRGRGDAWLKVGAVKMFHGNSLSGRTCWLYEPYHKRPDYYGIPPADSQQTLNRKVLEVHQAGLQACIHSNGDREIDMVLDAFEAALAAHPRDDHRHRIEHASVSNAAILDRVKRLGVVLAPHSYIWEHGDKMEAYGPRRWPWMHPNGKALELGIPVAGTSDAPVSAAVPMLRIQSMVTRRSAEGSVYGPEQRVTVEQAIRAWTLGSAYASFDEETKGSITVGKLADFVVLAKDPRQVPPDELRDVAVDMTVVGGNIKWAR
jgi:predicted amidohydrolase YtcJ